MARALTVPDPGPRRLLAFLVLSLLVHALLLAWLGRTRLASEGEPPPIVVSLAAPPPGAAAQKPPAKPAQQAQPKAQIVSPSDRDNEVPPLGRSFLSDRDNSVDKESVRRGNPEAGTPNVPEQEQAAVAPREAPPPRPAAAVPPPPKPAPPAARPAPKPPAAPARKPAAPAKPAARAEARAAPSRAQQEKAARESRRALMAQAEQSARRAAAEAAAERRALPGRDALLAPAADVLARARGDKSAGGGAPSEQVAANDPHRDLLSAPPPARGLFSGLRGNFDDLPDVAAGSLTMLNTKADRFAPFVRRVGTRVFQNMLIYQRRDLKAPEILAAGSLVTVKALLDSKGRLKDISVVDRSGSHAVDQTLLDALREAAFDRNPPAEAANPDGEFEFIFQAQLLAAVAPGPGGPQIREVESRLRVGLL